MSRYPLEAARRVHQLGDSGVGLGQLAQLLHLLNGVLERDVQRVWDQARHAVDIAVAHAEGASAVADGGLRAQRPERDDLRHAVAAVALGGVADHFLATVVGEVEVDIGHLAAFEVQEALEHQRYCVGSMSVMLRQ